ncbi:4Fe-4S dicluster domain protein [Candidatus Methanoperedenaceae archaeon GB50]|nr:4Fe-4S dicluster domain protein [Candidatus Methanoperedenaceae archaeon GB50]
MKWEGGCINLRLVLKKNKHILQKIEEISGENVFACYQCGMCTAGCPMVSEMDILPNQVIRLLQLGAMEEVINTRTVWLCASCYTCGARCPKGVNLSRLMEAIRLMILREQNQDYVRLEEMVKESLPQIVLISALRKFTA